MRSEGSSCCPISLSPMERDDLQHSESAEDAEDAQYAGNSANAEDDDCGEVVDGSEATKAAEAGVGPDGPVDTELDDFTSDLSPLVTELESALRCPMCFFICHPPVWQCSNGHVMCDHCADSVEDRGSRCPVCRVAVRPPHRAHHLERLAATLSRVSCAWAEHGCVHRGPYLDGEAHAAQCQFREVECPFTHLNHPSAGNSERGSGGACSWSGPHSALICHLQAHHSESIWWGGGSTMLGIGSDRPLRTPVLVVPSRSIQTLVPSHTPGSLLQADQIRSESPQREDRHGEASGDACNGDEDDFCESGAVFVVNASVVSGPRVYNRAGDTGSTSKLCIGVVGVATPGMDAGMRDLNLTIRLPTPVGDWTWEGPVSWCHYRGYRVTDAVHGLEVPVAALEVAHDLRHRSRTGRSGWARRDAKELEECPMEIEFNAVPHRSLPSDDRP